jgi:hypothetical protein
MSGVHNRVFVWPQVSESCLNLAGGGLRGIVEPALRYPMTVAVTHILRHLFAVPNVRLTFAISWSR